LRGQWIVDHVAHVPYGCNGAPVTQVSCPLTLLPRLVVEALEGLVSKPWTLRFLACG
jgi:hypothetical protein